MTQPEKDRERRTQRERAGALGSGRETGRAETNGAQRDLEGQ